MRKRQDQQQQGREGNRQLGQQSDHRPQQSRDLQRNKQSDSGQHMQGDTRQSGAGGGKQHGHREEDEGRQQNQQNVHGEGNYAASKQYNDATRDFAQSGRVEGAARGAAPKSDDEASQMQAAEAEGRRHAKGEDPALSRKRSELAPDAARAPKPGGEEE